MIREIGIGALGVRWRGACIGEAWALIPLPVDADLCLQKAGLADFADTDDAWDDAFEALVQEILAAVAEDGPLEVVAPTRSHPLAGGWRGRLNRWLALEPTAHPLAANPDHLPACEALLTAARDDSYLARASVHGRHATVETSDGHPILWLWTASGTGAWEQLTRRIEALSATRPIAIDWSSLGPPTRYPAGRVLVDAAHNMVYWTDGANVLAMPEQLPLPHPGNAGCEAPRLVFMPSEEDWPHRAPPWAHACYRAVLRDLTDAGLRVCTRGEEGHL